jgi:hypothetical protein
MSKIFNKLLVLVYVVAFAAIVLDIFYWRP